MTLTDASSGSCTDCLNAASNMAGSAFAATFDTSLVSGSLFFFQAEDGIRDIGVTGVQTCALPIYMAEGGPPDDQNTPRPLSFPVYGNYCGVARRSHLRDAAHRRRRPRLPGARSVDRKSVV